MTGVYFRNWRGELVHNTFIESGEDIDVESKLHPTIHDISLWIDKLALEEHLNVKESRLSSSSSSSSLPNNIEEEAEAEAEDEFYNNNETHSYYNKRPSPWRITMLHTGRPLTEKIIQDAVVNETPIWIECQYGLLGGKGGFGSMLRSQGGRMAGKTSNNFGACRDLTGHRLRTLEEAKMLAEFKEREETLKKEKEEKKKRKLQQVLDSQNDPPRKHFFEDPKYMQETEEIVESVTEVVEIGIKNSELLEKEQKLAAEKEKQELEKATKKFASWDGEDELPELSSSDSESDTEAVSSGSGSSTS